MSVPDTFATERVESLGDCPGSVHHAFVTGAWGNDQGVGDKGLILAGDSAAFTKAFGLAPSKLPCLPDGRALRLGPLGATGGRCGQLGQVAQYRR